MEEKELLSDEEMSALLPPEDPTPRERQHRIVPYNFRHPDRLSKEQVRSLYLLHDLFAHSLTTGLPLFLRTIFEVDLISVEQKSYGDYVRGLSDPTNIFTFAVEKLNGVFAIELNCSIAFPIIDRMLGGAGESLSEQRAATELELKILEGFFQIATDNYREAWLPIVELKIEPTGRETRPQMLQIVAPNEVVVVVVYQVQVGEVRGTMSICLPVGMLESVIENFNQAAYSQNKVVAPEATAALLKKLANSRFPVAAELEKVSAAVVDLMNLAKGDVLRTNHRLEKSVKVTVGGDSKFTGKLAAVDGRVVVQVKEKMAKHSIKTA